MPRRSSAISAGLAGRGFARAPGRAAIASASLVQIVLGHTEVTEPREPREPRELLCRLVPGTTSSASGARRR